MSCINGSFRKWLRGNCLKHRENHSFKLRYRCFFGVESKTRQRKFGFRGFWRGLWAYRWLIYCVGSGGTLPNHCHRDLLLRMPGVLMPKLHHFDIPLVHQIAGKRFPSTHMILPHELFSCIYHYYPTAFFTYILPSTDILESFWDSVKGWCAPDQTPTAALEFIEVLQSADILQLKACSIRQQTATRLDNLIPAEI